MEVQKDLKCKIRLTMPITTVIFDYGCVLSLAPTPEDYEPLRKAIGVDAAAFQEIYWRNRDAYDLDALDASAYWQEIGHDVRASPSLLNRFRSSRPWTVKSGRRPNPVMVEWVRVLRGARIEDGGSFQHVANCRRLPPPNGQVA